MPKSVIIPAGSSAPLAPFVPGTLADGVVYVSGTLAFDQHNNVLFADDPKAPAEKPAASKQSSNSDPSLYGCRRISGNYPQGDRDGGWHDGGCDLQQHLYYRLEKLRRD